MWTYRPGMSAQRHPDKFSIRTEMYREPYTLRTWCLVENPGVFAPTVTRVIGAAKASPSPKALSRVPASWPAMQHDSGFWLARPSAALLRGTGVGGAASGCREPDARPLKPFRCCSGRPPSVSPPRDAGCL